MGHHIPRRALVAGALAAALASHAAAADDRTVHAKKVFPFLDAYYRIPQQDRSRFSVGYLVSSEGGAPGLTLIHAGRRTPIPIGREGKAMRLPTAEELEQGQVGIATAGKMRTSMIIEPATPPAPEIDAAALAASIAQANSNLRKAAPALLRLSIPKIEQASFRGVATGEVLYADGRRAALPAPKGRPVFEPAKHPGAKSLRFPAAPSLIVLGS